MSGFKVKAAETNEQKQSTSEVTAKARETGPNSAAVGAEMSGW